MISFCFLINFDFSDSISGLVNLLGSYLDIGITSGICMSDSGLGLFSCLCFISYSLIRWAMSFALFLSKDEFMVHLRFGAFYPVALI